MSLDITSILMQTTEISDMDFLMEGSQPCFLFGAGVELQHRPRINSTLSYPHLQVHILSVNLAFCYGTYLSKVFFFF